MRPILLSAAILVATALTGCAFLQRPPPPPLVVTAAPANFVSHTYSRIVVIPKVTGGNQFRGNQATIGNMIESSVVADLLNKGFTVVERSDLDRVLKEIGLQSNSGLTDTSNAVKVGRMLNADGLLIVDLSQLEENRENISNGAGGYFTFLSTGVSISAKFISIQQGTQVWVASFTGHRSEQTADQALQEVIAAIVAKFPSKNPVPVVAPAAGTVPAAIPAIAPAANLTPAAQ